MNHIWSNKLEFDYQKLNHQAREIINYSSLGSAVSVDVSQSLVADMILQLNVMLKLTNNDINVYWLSQVKE